MHHQLGSGARAPYVPTFSLSPSLCPAIFFLVGICVQCDVVVPTSTSYEGNTKQFARIELAPLGEECRWLLDFFAVVLQFDRLENSVNLKKLSTGNGQYVEI